MALVVKNLPASTGNRDVDSIPGSGDVVSTPGSGISPGEGISHSSILAWRIPMDRGAWWATVHAVTEWT